MILFFLITKNVQTFLKHKIVSTLEYDNYKTLISSQHKKICFHTKYILIQLLSFIHWRKSHLELLYFLFFDDVNI